MLKKVAVLFAMGAFVLAAETYNVTLFQPTMVQGKELKPGPYKLGLKNNVLVIANGKESVETPVKVETTAQKFNTTSIRYATGEGRYSIQEIRLGGTKTKLILNP